MKININKQNANSNVKRINLKNVNQSNVNNENDAMDDELTQQCDDIKKKLYDTVVQDMQDSAIDIDISEESLEKNRKKYKMIRIKQLALYSSTLGACALIVIFGFFKTFFNHKYTGEEIAFLANYYNYKTNFPESGVQGFLESNMQKLLMERLAVDSNVKEVNLGIPVVTRINPKSDTLANVYFYANVKSNVGETKINAMLPIYWDEESLEYSPAGTVIITPNKPTNENVEERVNSLLSFENIAKEENSVTEQSKTFVNNFFTMLYSDQDVSPYYRGNIALESKDLKYNGMNEYVLYRETNGNGYNCTCKITLTMTNGVSYTTQKYLTLEPSGESWIVKAVL